LPHKRSLNFSHILTAFWMFFIELSSAKLSEFERIWLIVKCGQTSATV